MQFFCYNVTSKMIFLYAGDRPQLNHDYPKLIQQPAGYDVRLRCGLHGSHADFMENSDVFWDFKVFLSI